MMNQQSRDLKIDAGVNGDKPPTLTGGPHRGSRMRLWVNWALAALTVLGAVVGIPAVTVVQ